MVILLVIYKKIYAEDYIIPVTWTSLLLLGGQLEKSQVLQTWIHSYRHMSLFVE